MMTTFDFTAPNRIIFGAGKLAEAGPLARNLGRKALVVTGRTPERAGPLLRVLEGAGVEWVTFSVLGEPEMGFVRLALALAKTESCDLVVGMGGGAAIDTAKAVAILCTHEGDVVDYLEIIGAGCALEREPLPFIAIPTTAGSGAEATWNSVIISREHRAKVSLRSRMMAAKVALIDPELTYDLPASLTTQTGMDALTQLLETYVSVRATPPTDGLCLQGLSRAARSLWRAASSPDPDSRADMSLAALLGGLVLANAGLGAVHGIAGPLGGMIEAPHGALCAALLPAVVTGNLAALRRRPPSSEALFRYAAIAAVLTGDADATPDDLACWLEALVADLGIPRLSTLGFDPEDMPELVAKAMRAGSMKGNPVVLTASEIEEIVAAAL